MSHMKSRESYLRLSQKSEKLSSISLSYKMSLIDKFCLFAYSARIYYCDEVNDKLSNSAFFLYIYELLSQFYEISAFKLYQLGISFTDILTNYTHLFLLLSFFHESLSIFPNYLITSTQSGLFKISSNFFKLLLTFLFFSSQSLSISCILMSTGLSLSVYRWSQMKNRELFLLIKFILLAIITASLNKMGPIYSKRCK